MDLQNLNEISKVFSGFKKNPESVYKVINSVKKSDLKNVLDYYHRKEKNYIVNKVIATRVRIIRKLIRGVRVNEKIVNNVINEIKKDAVKSGYKKNIFHSWHPNWRILFPIYYHSHRQNVKNELEIFVEKIIDELNLFGEVLYTINDFNGPTNFGKPECWFAIYNATHDSQKTAFELFFKLENGNIKYGLYKHDNEHNNNLVNCKVDSFKYYNLINEFKKHIKIIKNDVAKVKSKKGNQKNRSYKTRKGKTVINVDGYFRKSINSTFVESKHKKIQLDLFRALKKEHGIRKVKMEEDFVDIKVETSNFIYLYEIKTKNKSLLCIRDAIGQLLLYACRQKNKTNKKIKLIVIGLGKENLDSRDFNNYLYENFGFQFDYKYAGEY